jgi:hypothetical protein
MNEFYKALVIVVGLLALIVLISLATSGAPG